MYQNYIFLKYLKWKYEWNKLFNINISEKIRCCLWPVYKPNGKKIFKNCPKFVGLYTRVYTVILSEKMITISNMITLIMITVRGFNCIIKNHFILHFATIILYLVFLPPPSVAEIFNTLSAGIDLSRKSSPESSSNLADCSDPSELSSLNFSLELMPMSSSRPVIKVYLN